MPGWPATLVPCSNGQISWRVGASMWQFDLHLTRPRPRHRRPVCHTVAACRRLPECRARTARQERPTGSCTRHKCQALVAAHVAPRHSRHCMRAVPDITVRKDARLGCFAVSGRMMPRLQRRIGITPPPSERNAYVEVLEYLLSCGHDRAAAGRGSAALRLGRFCHLRPVRARRLFAAARGRIRQFSTR